ncbi:MAG: Holliday junction branch migration DNA helicase RuvB [Elusimicrobia bacterium HGW-Elusimicrobia-3]|nr:MAG: Holliday junction branch migration DNA helicase RuvB [Elusimicrobia bacterium HGW-Elusimicrobia-3]
MPKNDDILSARPATDETARMESALRPSSLDEFVGQTRLKENLKVFIQAARQRREPLDHCLFYSPPGLGKTTLSHILAREMGVNMKVTSGPVLSKPGDLAAMLTTELAEGDILFIDEIHRLNAAVEEALYPVMEDFLFFINTGQGPGATTLKLAVPRFTLVGATTRSGLLTGPLRDRFGIVFNLGFYEEEEITQILVRSAGILGSKAERPALSLLARRSRGTPRIANRLLKRVRDFADVRAAGVITVDVTEAAMASMEIDAEGLDNLDRRILSVIAEKFGGGPVGIETLAVAVSEEADTLTDVIEPFLMQGGFLKRTTRGRVITAKAAAHMGFKLPRQAELL